MDSIELWKVRNRVRVSPCGSSRAPECRWATRPSFRVRVRARVQAGVRERVRVRVYLRVSGPLIPGNALPPSGVLLELKMLARERPIKHLRV